MTFKDILGKLPFVIFMLFIGLIFGYIVGGIFAEIGVTSAAIAWQEITTFLGGACGFVMPFLED